MMILGPTTLMDGTRAEEAVAEHARVLDALNARDGMRAEAEMGPYRSGATGAAQGIAGARTRFG